MNNKQTQKFLDDLFMVWEKGLVNKLASFYSQEMIGYYQDQTICFDDIVNRLEYLQQRYNKRKYHVTQFMQLDNEMVIVWTRQSGIDTKNNQPYDTNVITVYKLDNELITKAWLLTDVELDYFSNPDSKDQPENITLEHVNKTQFLALLKDYQEFDKDKIVLTEREQECLFYYLAGFTAKEIAKKLDINYRTVQDYLAIVKDKYQCGTKQELRAKLFPVGPLV